MSTGTLAVAVRKDLVDGLAALPQFSEPWGETNQVPLLSFAFKAGAKERERVWTQDARITHTPASMRATRTFRDERGTFRLRILVEGVGLDPYTTSSRAVALGHVVEDYVAVHANWPAGVSHLMVDGDGELLEAFNDLGSLAELTYTLTWRARLT